jgi:uncharacterized protein (DUF58 family)
MSMPTGLKRALDWGKLAPLRLRARSVADGVYAGAHRSLRRGSGVEFGGHRAYVPGDDLRWLDRHALMRHDRLLVREFETETDRALRLVVDASRSMAFRSPRAPVAKLGFATLVAAALGRVAAASGDPVGLDWLGGRNTIALRATSGREAFDRVVGALESAKADGDLSADSASVERTLARVARQSGRGAVIVFLSDLVDLPPDTLDRLGALAVRGRSVVAVRLLDPVELDFPFQGPVRLAASEGSAEVETDARMAREGYLKALEDVAARWHARLLERGGGLVRASTTSDPVEVVRAVLETAAARRP